MFNCESLSSLPSINFVSSGVPFRSTSSFSLSSEISTITLLHFFRFFLLSLRRMRTYMISWLVEESACVSFSPRNIFLCVGYDGDNYCNISNNVLTIM